MRLAASLVALAGLTLGSACGSDDNGDDTSVGLTRWSLTAEVGGAEFDIVIEVGSSSCDSLDRVEVDEGAETVTIEAYVRSRRADVCTADMATEVESIALDAPLGDRELLGCDGNLEPGSSTRDCSVP